MSYKCKRHTINLSIPYNHSDIAVSYGYIEIFQRFAVQNTETVELFYFLEEYLECLDATIEDAVDFPNVVYIDKLTDYH